MIARTIDHTITKNSIHLIDFGIAKKYRNADNTLVPNKKQSKIIGSFQFVTKFQLQYETMSRRDDMVQIVYIIIYMLNKFKPLLDDIAPNNDFNKLMEFKATCTPREFCRKAQAEFLTPLLE